MKPVRPSKPASALPPSPPQPDATLSRRRDAAQREIEALQRAEQRLQELADKRRARVRSSAAPAAATEAAPPAPAAVAASPTQPAAVELGRARDQQTAREHQVVMHASPAVESSAGASGGDGTPPQEPYRPWSWPGGDPYAVEPLAHGYGDNRVTAMAVDPERVHLYLEMTDQALAEARGRLGAAGQWAWHVIRCYDTTQRVFDGSNAHSHFDVAIERDTRSWYLALAQPGRTFVFEAGLKSHEGYFQAVARSNAVFLPSDRVAAPGEPRFMTVVPRREVAPPARYRSKHPALLASGAGAPPPMEDPRRQVTLYLREGTPFAVELRDLEEAFWLRAERSLGGGWRVVSARDAAGVAVAPEEILRRLGGGLDPLGLDDVPVLDLAWTGEGPLLFELHEINGHGSERLVAWTLWLRGRDDVHGQMAEASRLIDYILGGYRRMRESRVGSEFAQAVEEGHNLHGESGRGLFELVSSADWTSSSAR